MWDRRHIFNDLDRQSGGLQSRDGAFASRPGTLDLNFEFTDAVACRFFRCLLSGALAGERRAFSTSLEAARSRTRPTKRIASSVRDRNDRVVKSRLDMCDCRRNVATGFLLA